MKIIKMEANPSGSRPGLMDWNRPTAPEGWSVMPEAFVSVFYPSDKECAGFVNCVFEDGQCTFCEWNEEAYQAYLAALPETTEVVEEPTQLDRVEAQATYTAIMTDTLLTEE